MMDLRFAEFLYQGLSLSFKLGFSLKLEEIESRWASCYCTDTGLSSGMHLG